MNLLRKVMAPAALAAGFLVFLGAVGHGGVTTASAAQGDFCAIEGPYIAEIGNVRPYMLVGETALVVGRIENNTGDVQEFYAELDNDTGDADITSIVRVDSNRYQYRDIRPVDEVSRVPVVELSNAGRHDNPQRSGNYRVDEIQRSNGLWVQVEDLLDWMNHRFKYSPIGDVCGDDVDKVLKDCVRDSRGVASPPGNDDDDGVCDFSDLGGRRGWVDDLRVSDIAALIDELIAAGELECDDIAEAVGDLIINRTNRWGESQQEIEDFIFDLCAGNLVDDDDDPIATWWDDFAFVDVTCKRAGTFDLTFWHEERNQGASTGTQRSIQIECRGEPADGSTITVRPSKVEIIPAMGSVSHSLVTVELLDDDDNAAGLGFEVDFSTNICSIEVGGVNDAAKFAAANTIFRAYNVSVASTADAVENSAAATALVDTTRTSDTVVAFANGDDTIAAAILGCGPQDTGTAATPGTATITARIEVMGGQDIIRTATVTVVGPPADLKVTAAPATLRCGEKATITATVKDSIGQNVSDHTRVEAVTNAGGVLGGTGAVAGQAGPVVPVSSTVAETFDGVATFYLLTSDLHVGPYEVVVTTGGNGSVTDDLGGVFSTRAQVAQQTVTCTLPAAPAPAPAPTISAPRTGTGITPPSTGDGGLLASESSSTSWTLFAALGIVASVVGVASVKLARR